MTIKAGQLASANEVSTEFALSNNELQMISLLEKAGTVSFVGSDTDFTKIRWDTFINQNKISSSSNIIFNVAAKSINLTKDILSETTHCDFTSVTLPSGWVTGSQTFITGSWDSVNDEQDFSGNIPGAAGASGSIAYNTTMTEGCVKVGIRNIGFSLYNDAYGGSVGITWGADYIKINQ